MGDENMDRIAELEQRLAELKSSKNSAENKTESGGKIEDENKIGKKKKGKQSENKKGETRTVFKNLTIDEKQKIKNMYANTPGNKQQKIEEIATKCNFTKYMINKIVSEKI